MKTVNVAAAVIRRGNEVFAVQRGYGEYEGGWEFPGGKLEEGESGETALIREIREELNTEIRVLEYMDTVEMDYEKFHLSMQCFLCEVISGDLTLNEAKDARWLTKESLYSADWLPADLAILDQVERYL